MLCFVFPGQGSQRPAMGAGFVDDDSWSVVDAAAQASGRDVAHLLLEAEADELVETRNAQLATFVHSMVVLDAFGRRGLTPDVAAGHSLGELSALCAAGVLQLDDAVRLVTERGEAMQACTTSRDGAMAAVLGLDADPVSRICERSGGEVWVANLNAPGQVVIAGDPGDVDAAGVAAKDAGAKRVLPLDVAGAFHTPFMAPAGDRLGAAIAATAFSEAKVPVVANVDARDHRNADEWPDLLRRQLVSPVRWAESVETLVGLGVTSVVEAGPGSVLTGTVKRIAPNLDRWSAASPDEVDAVVAAVGART